MNCLWETECQDNANESRRQMQDEWMTVFRHRPSVQNALRELSGRVPPEMLLSCFVVKNKWEKLAVKYLRERSHDCQNPRTCCTPGCGDMKSKTHVAFHVRLNDWEELLPRKLGCTRESYREHVLNELRQYEDMPGIRVHLISDSRPFIDEAWQRFGNAKERLTDGKIYCFGPNWEKLQHTNNRKNAWP